MAAAATDLQANGHHKHPLEPVTGAVVGRTEPAGADAVTHAGQWSHRSITCLLVSASRTGQLTRGRGGPTGLVKRAWQWSLQLSLVLALLFAQSVALRHAIEHSPFGASSELAEEADASWGHASGTPACALIDQLLVGQGTAGDFCGRVCVRAAVTRLAAPVVPTVNGAALAAYEARGPPVA